jgi:signal recognition particle receptor subunit beta
LPARRLGRVTVCRQALVDLNGRRGGEMAFANHTTRELNFKLVYWGAGMVGKTTNMRYVHDQTAPGVRGKMVRLDSETEQMLVFDFSPRSLGEIRGLRPRMFLYTVPGPMFDDTTRQLLLSSVDGVVFVADSQAERIEGNIDSLARLEAGLADHGLAIEKVPMVVQYNKRDLPGVMPVAELEMTLNPLTRPAFMAVATDGIGVLDTLRATMKHALNAAR